MTASTSAVPSQSMNEMFKSMAKAEPSKVNIESIDVAKQIRVQFEDKDNRLTQLADNIKVAGILQPLLLRTRPAGRYELIAGERRLRAAKMAGLTEVPCLIRTLNDEQAKLAQFFENIHRKNLTLLEEAQSLRDALDLLNGDRAALAMNIQKSDTWITQRLNLLDLPPETQRLVSENLSADATAINAVRQIEKLNPAAAKALVDGQKAAPGKAPLRKAAEDMKKAVKPEGKGGSTSTATPRDRAVQEPSAAVVKTGGMGIFPTAPAKPHERAMAELVEQARKPGSDAVKLAASVTPEIAKQIEDHVQKQFKKGQGATDLAVGITAGLLRNEFGKNAIELFNLMAFLQGNAKSERFSIETALAAITNVST